MNRELTFEEIAEIVTANRKGERATKAIEIVVVNERLPQLKLIGILGVLADYFNGENNWVPEMGEYRHYIRINHTGQYYADRTTLSYVTCKWYSEFTPPFKESKDITQAITIIERDFPELIESFTKKK